MNKNAKRFLLIALKSFGVLLLFSFAYYIVHALVVYLSNFTMIKYAYRQHACLILADLIVGYLYFATAKGEGQRRTVNKTYDLRVLIPAHATGSILFLLIAFFWRNHRPAKTLVIYLLGIAYHPITLTGNYFMGAAIVTLPLLALKIGGLLYGRHRALQAKPYLESPETAEEAEKPKKSWKDSLK
ncbi:MAG: hypothetical protein J6M34_00205 [Clostridia bacterium]|nr:hypothetical protein [Clostridia bacterium]